MKLYSYNEEKKKLTLEGVVPNMKSKLLQFVESESLQIPFQSEIKFRIGVQVFASLQPQNFYINFWFLDDSGDIGVIGEKKFNAQFTWQVLDKERNPVITAIGDSRHCDFVQHDHQAGFCVREKLRHKLLDLLLSDRGSLRFRVGIQLVDNENLNFGHQQVEHFEPRNNSLAMLLNNFYNNCDNDARMDKFALNNWI